MPKAPTHLATQTSKKVAVSRDWGDCWLETSYKLSSPYADVWVAQGMTPPFLRYMRTLD
jgi:hypothetical protein